MPLFGERGLMNPQSIPGSEIYQNPLQRGHPHWLGVDFQYKHQSSCSLTDFKTILFPSQPGKSCWNFGIETPISLNLVSQVCLILTVREGKFSFLSILPLGKFSLPEEREKNKINNSLRDRWLFHK